MDVDLGKAKKISSFLPRTQTESNKEETKDDATEDEATEDDNPHILEVNHIVAFEKVVTWFDGLFNRLTEYVLTEKQLKENGFPLPDPNNSSTAIFHIISRFQQLYIDANLNANVKICIRCGKYFIVDEFGRYAKKKKCFYHPEKEWIGIPGHYVTPYFTCCKRDLNAEGCSEVEYHVHESNKWENRTGYLQTLPCPTVPDGDYGVYALDTEMVYTQVGLELARVTVVDCNNKVVYDTFVRPDTKVIDFNTRFSGITEENMKGVITTIRDVQAKLRSLFTEETILIGHSLECDLTAVKIIHSKVVDTAVVFRDDRGPRYKPALKTLAAKYLKKTIQDDVDGHDSGEDAIACMELMQWLVKEDA